MNKTSYSELERNEMLRQLMSFALIALNLGLSSPSFAVLYRNDAQTRHLSTKTEKQAFMSFRNTSFLISKDLMLTTKHTATDGASPMKVGDALYYVSVKEILEESKEALGDVDYKIQRIIWSKKEGAKIVPSSCPSGRHLVNQISSIEKDYNALPHAENKFVMMAAPFNVFGYPHDRDDATTSRGTHLFFFPMESEPKARHVYFNAGAIAGNSGGPILDDEGKLIGIVTGGPDESQEPTFDPANPLDFNFGLSAQSLYELSPLFKKVVDEASVSKKIRCE